MFEQNEQKIEQIPKVEPAKIEEKPIEIHTMPEKFLSSEQKAPQKKSPRFYLIIALIVIVVAGVSAYFLVFGGLWDKIKNGFTSADLTEQNNNLQTNTAPIETNITVPVEPNFVSEAKIVKIDFKDANGDVISSASLSFPQGALKTDINLAIAPSLTDENIDANFQVVGGSYITIPKIIELNIPVNFTITLKQGLVKPEIFSQLKIGGLKNNLWEVFDTTLGTTLQIAGASLTKIDYDAYAVIVDKKTWDTASGSPQSSANSSNTNSAILPSTQDTDQDGLTDQEESIYSTDAQKADTDGDTYSDSSELINLYNPIKAKGALLSNSGLINTFHNPTYNYTLFYPSSFLAKPLEGTENKEVMFSAPTGEYFEVLVQDNLEKLSIRDWYLEQFSEVNVQNLKEIKVAGQNAIYSPNEQTIYFANGDKIFVITYSAGAEEKLNFKSTYQMMLNSFKLK